VTMLELIVAIFVSAIAVAMIMRTWTGLSQHIYRNERRAHVRVSADRISEALASELRKAHTVLAWNSGEIAFEAASGDTVRYTHDGATLLRNETPVYVSSPGGYVSEFEVSRSRDAGYLTEREQEQVLLRVKLTVEDSLENSADAQVEVSVRAVPGAEGWGWGF
jgi:type II secretory pathway pseudopilin PulG